MLRHRQHLAFSSYLIEIFIKKNHNKKIVFFFDLDCHENKWHYLFILYHSLSWELRYLLFKQFREISSSFFLKSEFKLLGILFLKSELLYRNWIVFNCKTCSSKEMILQKTLKQNEWRKLAAILNFHLLHLSH